MKKKFLISIVLLLLVLLTMSTVIGAEEYFTTERFDVTLDVNEDHSYDVTNSVAVNFIQPRHGLYFNILRSGTFYRQINGKEVATEYSAKISNVSVGDYMFKESMQDNVYQIQVGDPDTYVNGQQIYPLKYTWDPGDDGISEFDDVYYNLLSTNWPTVVEAADFVITLPRSVETNTPIEFIGGIYGSTDTTLVDYTFDGQTIKGHLKRSLSAGEGMTLNVRLPKDYFIGNVISNEAKSKIKSEMNYLFPSVVIVGAIVLAAISIFSKKTMKTESMELMTEKTLQEITDILRQAAEKFNASIAQIDKDPLSEFDQSADIEVVLRGKTGLLGAFKSPRPGAANNIWAVQVYVTETGDARHIELIALGESSLSRGLRSDGTGILNLGSGKEHIKKLVSLLQ